jgi:hypothetical protein
MLRSIILRIGRLIDLGAGASARSCCGRNVVNLGLPSLIR